MNKDSTTRKLLRAVEEFHTYIVNNLAFIPNYGERYRQGDRISTGFVESTVNYVVAKLFYKVATNTMEPDGRTFTFADTDPNTQWRIGANI